MTALTTGRRQQLRKDYSTLVSARREAFGLTRAELDTAVAATDDWIEANSAAFNLALPVAIRNKLTAAQKTELFCLVAIARNGG